MKTIIFSTVHIRDAEHGQSVAAELHDWYDRMMAAFDNPTIFLCETAPDNYIPDDIPSVCAGIPHTRKYHGKDWCYYQACMNYALFHVMHDLPDFDVVVSFLHDAVCGVRLQPLVDEFMHRKEVFAAPVWYGHPDMHFMMMKRPAVIDVLYSLPFTPLRKFFGLNQIYCEHAYGILFRGGRWWNPWPEWQTIRQEYGEPLGHCDATEDEIIQWPILAKGEPDMIKKYKKGHPICELQSTRR